MVLVIISVSVTISVTSGSKAGDPFQDEQPFLSSQSQEVQPEGLQRQSPLHVATLNHATQGGQWVQSGHVRGRMGPNQIRGGEWVHQSYWLKEFRFCFMQARVHNIQERVQIFPPMVLLGWLALIGT